MAQFDLYSYPSQVLCVLLGFLIFYFFILRFYIVPFSRVLKMRRKLVKLGLKLKEKRKAEISPDFYSFFLREIFKK